MDDLDRLRADRAAYLADLRAVQELGARLAREVLPWREVERVAVGPGCRSAEGILAWLHRSAPTAAQHFQPLYAEQLDAFRVGVANVHARVARPPA